MQVDLKFKIKAGDGQITFPIYRVPVSGGTEPVDAGDIQNLQVDLDRQVLQSSQEGVMVTAAYSNVAEGTHRIVITGALNDVAFALVYAVRAEELGVPAEVVAPNAYVSLAPTGEGTIEQQIKDLQDRMGTAEGEIVAITAALPEMATKEEVQETLGEILEAIQALPDGQAVSAQVALNTAAIEGLQEDVSQLGQKVTDLNGELGHLSIETARKISGDGGIELTTSQFASGITDVIYFVKLLSRIPKIDAIDYTATSTGHSVSFYKVTMSGDSVTAYSLLGTTTIEKEGVNRYILPAPIVLGENEYIGISDSFCYGASDVIERNSYTISTATTGTWGYQAIGVNPVCFGEISRQLEEIVPIVEIVPNITKRVATDDDKEIFVSSALHNNTSGIWFNTPQNKLSFVSKLLFIAPQNENINFYKVTLDGNGDVVNYEVVISVTGTGKPQEVNIGVELDENEYIGVNGSFYYRNGVVPGYNYNISTGETSSSGTQEYCYSCVQGGLYDATIRDAVSLVKNSNGWIISQNTVVYFKKPSVYIPFVNTISFLAQVGTTTFYVVEYNEGESTANSIYPIISVNNSEAEIDTVKTVSFEPILLKENQYIGISGDMYFEDAADGAVKDLTISNMSVAPSDSWRTRNFFFKIEYVDKLSQVCEKLEQTENVLSSISESGELLNKMNGRAVLLNSGKLLAPIQEISGGTQNFDSFGLVVDKQFVIEKYYSLAQRTAKFLCKFNATTQAVFGCIAENSPDTVFVFDVNDKRLYLNSASKKCNILNGTDVFLVSISIDYQKRIVEIINVVTGDSSRYEWLFSGAGGSGDGAEYTPSYNWGHFWDKYYINYNVSTWSCQQIIIDCPKCDVLIYGDSITEPEAYYPNILFKKSWTQLLIKALGGKAITSGRSGTGIDSIYKVSGGVIDLSTSRIGNELPFIKPKYVMVTIGTNGGNTQPKLEALVDYIMSQGAIPILNHIPTNQQGTSGGYDYAAENLLIDAVRTTRNIKGVDFDIPTSLSYDGVNCDISQFWLEGTLGEPSAIYHHPNVKGSSTMMARVFTDVPEIFDI